MSGKTEQPDFKEVDVRRLVRRGMADLHKKLGQSKTPPSFQIHDARKACKRWRSYIWLLDDDSRYRFKGCDRAIRQAGRSLSYVRDAAVLAKASSDLARDAASMHQPPREASERAAIKAFLLKLEVAQKALKEVPKGRYFASQQRLSDSFEQVRQGGETARIAPTVGALHLWRKRVQRLRNQARIVFKKAPGQRELVASLTELADCLGNDHDLAVLAVSLRESKKPYSIKRLEEHRASLQKAAFNIAENLFDLEVWPFVPHLGAIEEQCG